MSRAGDQLVAAATGLGAATEDPDDVGTAWIERSDGTESKLNGGALITRAEARRLASEDGYELRERG